MGLGSEIRDPVKTYSGSAPLSATLLESIDFLPTQVEFYPHHGYLNISLTVWLGIYLFFIIERCLKIFMDSKARRRGETVGGRHSHHALPAKELENLLGSSVGTVLLESSVHPSTKYI
jgi:hypothetical protein